VSFRGSKVLGGRVFIMKKMGKWKLPPNVDHGVVHAYNKMRVGFKVQVEWGIGGLKWKWKCLMKIFDSTKPKFSHLFQATCSLHHLSWWLPMDFTYKVIGYQNLDPIAQGCRRHYVQVDELIWICSTSWYSIKMGTIIIQ
jgi:hypothetical protein